MTARRGSSRPTLEDVAARAGVSRATVSRVVNHRSTVNPRLVSVVNRAVAELGYTPNQAARSLMTRRTNAVALVAAEPDSRVFGDPFFSDIVHGVSTGLSAAGLQLILSVVESRSQLGQLEGYLSGGHVDGVLLISQHGSDQLGATLHDAGVPVVVGGRPLDETRNIPYVDNDNVGGARKAARHLVELGRTRIGTVCGPQDMPAGMDRLAGFRQGLGKAYRAGRVEEGDFSTDSGSAAMTRLLEREPELDAVFVANDLMAIGAMAALRQAGRTIPDDVAVIGFDDIALAAVAAPPLTTVRQHTRDQGRAMVRLLLSRIGGPAAAETPATDLGVDHVILDVDLVVRESA